MLTPTAYLMLVAKASLSNYHIALPHLLLVPQRGYFTGSRSLGDMVYSLDEKEERSELFVREDALIDGQVLGTRADLT